MIVSFAQQIILISAVDNAVMKSETLYQIHNRVKFSKR